MQALQGGPALRVLLAAIAAIGLVIATYFTALSYRLVAPDAAFIPRLCRLGPATCARVIESPRARLFGVPNSLLGIFFYAGVIGLAVAGGAPAWMAVSAQLVAWGTVVLGVYLSASLLFVTRVPCALCFTAHALNLALALLLAWAW